MNTDNCILNDCYNYLYDMCLKNPNDTNTWVYCVRNELCRIGLSNFPCSIARLCDNSLILIIYFLYNSSIGLVKYACI
jgi:hypothetical protein